MSHEQSWEPVDKRFNVELPKDLWIRDYEKLTEIDEDMISLVEKLREHYMTAMISNTIPEHAEINQKRGLFEPFDLVILSHEVKMTKQNPEIFKITLDRLGIKPSQAVFVDDVKSFVETAESVGINGVLFTGVEELIEELRALGVSNLPEPRQE